MPSRCSVRVIEARDLPLMDRDFAGAEFTDAFVEVRFASFEPCRTAVRRTQQPKWDEEFRFEVVDDAVLQARDARDTRTHTERDGPPSLSHTLTLHGSVLGESARARARPR